MGRLEYDPGSPSSSCGSSGYASGMYSPTHSSPTHDDEDDVDDYSPVCSDCSDVDDQAELECGEPEGAVSGADIPAGTIGTNVDEKEKSIIENEFDIFAIMYGEEETKMSNNQDDTFPDEVSLENVENDDDKRLETYKSFENNLHDATLSILMDVSSLISNQVSRSSDFVEPKTLETLLKYCSASANLESKAIPVIANICKSIKHFVQLLKNDAILKIQDLRESFCSFDCLTCKDIRAIGTKLLDSFELSASSGYGQGEIRRFLIKGEAPLQKRAAIMTTYAIKSPTILHSILFGQKALEVVLQIIFNVNDELATYAGSGITRLAENLAIIDVENNGYSNVIEYFDEYSYLNDFALPEDEKIAFVVQNNEELIYFKKTWLVESSDVLRTMLNSDFSEKRLRKVTLKETSADGLKYFFGLLSRTFNMEKCETEIGPACRSMRSTLEAFELAILYIIPRVENLILSVIRKTISHSNALDVFEWSLKNVNHTLLDLSVQYFLSATMTGDQKVQLFRQANQSDFSKEWRQLIVDTILQKCTQQ